MISNMHFKGINSVASIKNAKKKKNQTNEKLKNNGINQYTYTT